MKKLTTLLLCLVLLVPISSLSVSANNSQVQNANVMQQLSNKVDLLQQVRSFLSIFNIRFDKIQEENTVIPEESKEQITETPTFSSVHAYEKQVVDLVNKERAKYGISALTINEELCNGARMKSRDLHDNRYFSHTSPTYGSPFQMMKSLGISYRTAGENIAMGYGSPEAVVRAWMNSEGHRANILNRSYTEIGVGYIEDGGYYTQWFRG
jgi:uncharacterized YkwD family protein